MTVEHAPKEILLLTRTISTGLSTIRALGRGGFVVDVIASTFREEETRTLSFSKYVRSYEEVVSRKIEGETGETLLMEAIRSKYGKYSEKIVLLPTDDYTTSVIDRNRRELEEHFLMPFIGNSEPGELVRVMDKQEQCRLAELFGVAVPMSTKLVLSESGFELPEGLKYPVFVKPLVSIAGYKTEMAVCEDENSLREHIAWINKRGSNREILLQEYIKYDKQYTLVGVCDDNRIICPAVTETLMEATHETGLLIKGSLRPLDSIDTEAVNAVFELLKSLHYVGCFGVDLFMADGRIIFNEINFRTSGYSPAYFRHGVNMPLIFVQSLLRRASCPDDDHLSDEWHNDAGYGNNDSDEVCREYAEFDGMNSEFVYDQVAIDEYLHGGMSREMLGELLADKEKCILIGDAEDTEPSELFMNRSQERIDRKVKLEKRREKCIAHAMKQTDWDAETAAERIDAARERLGITYLEYKRNNFCLLTDEEQDIKYAELKAEKEAEENKKVQADPLIVVLSRVHSTGLAVVRSLGAADYEIDLIANCRKEGGSEIITQSKYIRNSVEIVSRKVSGGGDWAIVNELLKYREEAKHRRIVLFPTDDYTASVMDDNRDKLKNIFIMPFIVGGGQGSMTELMKKTVQSRLAVRAGLNMPSEWEISLREDVVLPDDIIYPCFCKPIESITGFKVEMAKCNDAQELEKHLKWLKQRNENRSVLVQEFLEIDNEIDLSGVCIGKDIIIPAIIKKTQVAQYEKGVTLAGKVVPFEEIEELMEPITRLMQSFNYLGMFDLEINIVGDKYYFNEVNLRSGGPNFAYFSSGVNLPALVVGELLGHGHKTEEERVGEYGKNFIYEKVAWDDYAHGYMSKSKLRRLLADADIRLMECAEDPVPTERFYNDIQETAERKHKNRKKSKLRARLRPYLGPIKNTLQGYPQYKPGNKRKPNSELPRVLVSGRNYCSNLCMAKSLSEVGYEVEVLRIFQRRPGKHNILRTLKPECKSKHVKAYYVCNSRRKNTRIVDRLKSLADPDRKMLLIPADDLVADIIDTAYDELSEFYIMPNINGEGGGISRMMNKDIQKAAAKAAGLPVLNSCVLRSSDIEDGEIVIPDSVSFPCFIKPNISKNSSKSQMMKCDTKEILIETLTERAASGYELLVEDFVDIKRELSYLGVSTAEGVVTPGYFEAVVGGEGKHRGVALLGRMLDTAEAEPLISQVNDYIASLKFNGLFDVDLIETTEGKVYFVELNLRYGASGYALTKSGANMPAMFADYMLRGIPVDKTCRNQMPGKTFTSEKVLMDEFIEGIITEEEIQNYMKQADLHFVMDGDDKKPYRHWKRNMKKARELREYNLQKAAENALEDAAVVQ